MCPTSAPRSTVTGMQGETLEALASLGVTWRQITPASTASTGHHARHSGDKKQLLSLHLLLLGCRWPG